MASLAGRQRSRLLQTELDQRLAGHLDRLPLLGYGAHGPDSCADGRSFPGIPCYGSDRRAETRPAKNTLRASFAAAAAFHLVIAGEYRIGRAINHDIREFELQFG